MSLLSVQGLKTHFSVKRGAWGRATVKAVDGVSFDVAKGEVLALVGESGCGKTTVGRSLLNLVPPNEGRVLFEQQSVLDARGAELMALRRKMQIVFQDPFSSLNHRMTVGELIEEGLVIHRLGDSKERHERVLAMMEKVGLNPDYHRRYPHEFSGGQRQRISIARALVLEPSFVVCDEAVSALDVSVQAQVLNLLADLKRDMNLSYLFIAHNLSVVEHIADRVAVMYLGRIVEMGSRHQIFNNPLHPYTKALLSAIPRIGGNKVERIPLKGDLPSPISPPSGCPFHERCPIAQTQCQQQVPQLKEQSNGALVACDLLQP